MPSRTFTTSRVLPILLGAVVLGGALVLAGWQWDVRLFKSVLPGYISMKANTAVGFIALAVSTFLLAERKGRVRWIAGMALAAFALVLALATLSEYLFKLDWGTDELLFPDPEAMKTRWPPGRFAPVTCVNFIFIGLALFLRELRQKRVLMAAQGLVIVAWVISFQAIVGYLCGVTYSFGSAFYTQIAVHTAVLFTALTTAVLLSFCDEGFMAAISGDGLAGRVGRRLLVCAVLVPPLVNLIQVRGAKLGWYDADFGVLLRVVGNVVLFSWMAFQTGLYLSESDQKRAEAERGQQQLLASEQQARQRIERLQSVTAALAQAMDVQKVGEILLDRGAEALESRAGVVLRRLEGSDKLELIASRNLPAEAIVRWSITPAEVELPVAEVLRTGEPLFVETGEELLSRFPLMNELEELPRPRSFVALPIKLDNRTIAAVGFVFRDEQVFDAGTREYAMAIAGQCALALERAFLFARERARSLELEKALRARDDLLSICSHELRTPVTSMRLQAQLTKRHVARGNLTVLAPDRVMKMVDQSDRQLTRLMRLIEEMLDFSRLRTGHLFHLSPAPFDLEDLTLELQEQFKHELDAAGCPLSVHVESPVEGNWDRLRIEQVVVNLLTNAIKYGAGKPIELTLSQSGDDAVIRVKDQGIGIAREDIGRIFEPYERAVTFTSISGLGLGLYISRRIVEAHGGTLRVTSEVGRGSTFTAVLPRNVAAVRAVG